MKKEVYILNKDCFNIGKEIGDIYAGEYGDSPEKIEELLKKGVIVKEKDLKENNEVIEDIAEYWRDIKKIRQEKKENNRIFSTNELVKLNINFRSLNGGSQLIVEDKYNFYPSTGKICNKHNKSIGRGYKKLLKLLNKQNYVRRK